MWTWLVHSSCVIASYPSGIFWLNGHAINNDRLFIYSMEITADSFFQLRSILHISTVLTTHDNIVLSKESWMKQTCVRIIWMNGIFDFWNFFDYFRIAPVDLSTHAMWIFIHILLVTNLALQLRTSMKNPVWNIRPTDPDP